MLSRLTTLSLVLIGLTACSSDDKRIIFDDRVGPNSKQLTKDLPNDLRGDEENRRYSGETLRDDTITETETPPSR